MHTARSSMSMVSMEAALSMEVALQPFLLSVPARPLASARPPLGLLWSSSSVTRPLVKELLQAGFSTREIATKLSINKSALSEYVKRTPGRPLSLHQQALLTRGISKNSYTSATEASAYWLQHYQLYKHRKARRVFAKEYRHWTVEQWKHVIWSDECKVQHIGKGLEKRYWSRDVNYDIYIPTLQVGGHSIMIWGCMTWAGLGLMVYIDVKLNLECYIELLEEAVPGSILKWKNIQRILPRDKLIFQQDNAHPHTAKVTKVYLEEVKLNVLPWPAMSPDLNPIEHVWQQLKKQLYQQRYTINNKAQLIAAINRFWATFPNGISPGTHKVDAQEVTGSLNLSFPTICHKLHFIEDTSS
ncbi:related to Transposase [Ustilago sp. UG-2017b]|nr:related to Transposase [Ustilago sp. UG-2017b]